MEQTLTSALFWIVTIALGVGFGQLLGAALVSAARAYQQPLAIALFAVVSLGFCALFYYALFSGWIGRALHLTG